MYIYFVKMYYLYVFVIGRILVSPLRFQTSVAHSLYNSRPLSAGGTYEYDDTVIYLTELGYLIKMME